MGPPGGGLRLRLLPAAPAPHEQEPLDGRIVALLDEHEQEPWVLSPERLRIESRLRATVRAAFGAPAAEPVVGGSHAAREVPGQPDLPPDVWISFTTGLLA